MSRVKVYQAAEGNAAATNSVLDKAGEAFEAVRRRAFELFEKRGGESGHELDDWFQAEQDLFFIPHAEMNEDEEGFRMTVSAPGFAAGEIDVIARPHELLVEAKTVRPMETRRDTRRASTMESRILFRRFGLAAPIQTDQVTARIDEGSLTIVAPKRATRQFSVTATAA